MNRKFVTAGVVGIVAAVLAFTFVARFWGRPESASVEAYRVSDDGLTLEVEVPLGVSDAVGSASVVREDTERVDVEVWLGDSPGGSPNPMAFRWVPLTLEEPLGDRAVYAFGSELGEVPLNNVALAAYPDRFAVSDDGRILEFHFWLSSGDAIDTVELSRQDSDRVVVGIWVDRGDGDTGPTIAASDWASVTLDEPLGGRQVFVFDRKMEGPSPIEPQE